MENRLGIKRLVEKIAGVERNLNIAVNETINKNPLECLYGNLPEFRDGRLSEIAEKDTDEWRPPNHI